MQPGEAYRVPKRTPTNIINEAINLRKSINMPVTAGIKADVFIDILNGLYAHQDKAAFHIVETDKMSELGMYDPLQGTINLRQDVYDKACEGCIESLYTIAHECGHMALHSGSGFCRLERLSQLQIDNLDADEHSEEQADLFACALKLHPKRAKQLINKKIPLSSISSVYKIPTYHLDRYIDRLTEECGYKINHSMKNQMELQL